MNINILSRSQTLLGKVGFVVVAVGMIAVPLSQIMPMVAEAVAPSYHVAVTSQSFGALSITLAGGASATHFTGNLSQQHIFIDWGDASTSDPVTPATFTASSTDSNFVASWGPITHLYTTTGSKTIKVAVCHQGCTGAEGADALITLNVIIPPASLTVIKHVIGGSATASDFTMHVAGTNVSLSSFPGAESPGTSLTLGVGSYNVTETGPSGYTASASAGCSGTAASGDALACTITNTYATKGTLHIVKTVVNDNGGSAGSGDWTMDITATNPTNNHFAGSASGVDVTVDPGTFSVAESGGPSGYTQTSAVGCSGSILAGETKTCTITNDDVAPSLTLTKIMNILHGGVAVATGWVLSAVGPVTLSGTTPVASDSTFKAGVYALSESGPTTGYSASDWACTGGSLTGSSLTIALGETVSCSITNSDVPAKLTVTKTVHNNNGGTKQVSDFPLFVDNTSVTSGTQNSYDAGSYTVSETSDQGYTGVIGGDCAADGTITLHVGDVKNCTIDNYDKAAGLTIIKNVVTDNGGTKTPADFTLYVDGMQVTNGIATTTLSAGTHTITEDNLSGYTQTSLTCNGGSLSGNVVTIANGDTVVCTITNDDVAPTVTINKVVTNDNGGSAGVNDFGLTVGGTAVDSGEQLAVDANTPVAINEAGLAGYSFVSITGDEGCPSVLGGTVTLAEGQSITCTITNDDIAPSLKLVKIVSGGEASATSWTLTATGNQESPVVLEGTTPVQSGPTFQTGTYNLGESGGPSHYSASAWSCVVNDGEPVNGAAVTLGLGDNATCTITNTFTPYSSDVSVVKTIDDSTPDAGQTVVYTITVSNAGPDDATNVKVTDVLPAGLSYVSDDSEGAYATSTGEWTVGTVANGASATLHITATVSASAGQTVTNSATVTNNNADENQQNNTGEISITVNTPVVAPPPSGGHGGGSGGGVTNPVYGPGSVLGASTTTVPQVLGASCGIFLNDYLRMGRKNNADEVKKLQTFLNEQMHLSLPVTGLFGPMTDKAVRDFQASANDSVLKPWVDIGLLRQGETTGYVYKTTKRWINMLKCESLNIPLPPLP